MTQQELRPVFVSLTTNPRGAVWEVYNLDGDLIGTYDRKQNNVNAGLSLEDLQFELARNEMKMVNNPKKKKGNNYE